MTDDSRAHSCPHEVPSHSPSYPRYMLSFCFGYFVILTNLLTLLFCDQNSRGHRTGRADSLSVLSLRSSAVLSSLRDRQSCCRAPREPAECAAEQAWPRPPHRHHSVVGLWFAGGGPCRGWERLRSLRPLGGASPSVSAPMSWRARLHLCFCGSMSRSPLRKGTQEDVKKLLASLKCPSVGGEFGGA